MFEESLKFINGILENVGEHLAEHVTHMGYPNGGRDAAIAETNITLFLAHELIDKKFSVYAEPSFTSVYTTGYDVKDTRRIDLVAATDTQSLAVEIKRRARASHVASDLRRLKEFQIQAAKRPNDQLQSRFSEASTSTALFVTSTFGLSKTMRSSWEGLGKPTSTQAIDTSWSEVQGLVRDYGGVAKLTRSFWGHNERFADTRELRLAWIAFPRIA